MDAALTLAVSAAVFLGASDFYAARSARTTASITVTRTAVMTSAVLAPLLLLVVDSQWILKDSILGGAAFNPRDGFGPGAQLECYCGLGEVQCEAPGTQVVC